MLEIDVIIENAVRLNATDLHIRDNESPRIRVDGKLKELRTVSVFSSALIVEQIFSRLPEYLAKKLRQDFEQSKDVDCAFTAFRGQRIRTNIYKTEHGLQVAMRLLPPKILSAEEIGLPFVVADICKRKSGLFIVTGANGSGKTTTLAAMIEIINASQAAHVLTIEHPVEYLFKSKMALISQREVGLHAESFYTALRSAVRENPDVVVLGEMRDLETTRTAIELAEMGRLVFATLHTRTAPSTIDRLIEQFPAGEQNQIRMGVSENLIGVLCQTLLEKSSGGLTAAFELLLNNDASRNMIREKKIPQLLSILQTGRSVGMCTMEDSILSLFQKKIITKEEAMLKAYRPQDMARLLQTYA